MCVELRKRSAEGVQTTLICVQTFALAVPVALALSVHVRPESVVAPIPIR